ncbi:extracellular solute-binding protein [Streptomyces sp. GXMU-J15]|uniref:Extracellular solute-binding protein n=1 Tax=Streptomyces fuscus TaxID=3048495 RepID=A0ABT7IUL9_9ACTN|nr:MULTISPECIES: extracellular solute-binding protein [Streptomyces]MDL2076284.1 extracellular solute-binding protein [Streptomyces fuscus]SBT88967.1 carbohydrate ABC transporter substrate-binding protein, CUT1 family [Streptomyces sp. DI166]
MGTRTLSAAMLATAVLTVTTACSGGGTPNPDESAVAPLNPKSASGSITVLTNRTDLVQDGTMKKYAAEFNKTYPKVKVKFEAITDYEGEVKIRMNTENYGDVLLIPGAVSKGDYPKFFAPLGEASTMSSKYLFTGKTEVDGKVYGIGTFGTASGFVYNKAVWKKAGITDWPTTPEEFLADLKTVKDKTGATPYYTNFKDAWPLSGQWTNGVGAVSCNSKALDTLSASDAPWAKGSDLNTLDKLLHDMVDQKLTEKDPSTTNWESSKTLLAKGEVGSMMLGSWAINQMRAAAEDAGTNPDDIGFMPVPAQTNGKFCATLVSDYQQAVNIHSDNKEAARAWIDWFTEESGYSEKEGAVSVLRSAPLPSTLKDYVDNDVKMVERSEDKTAEVNAIDDAAEIGLNKPDYRQKLIDIARGAQDGSLQGYFDELNKRWSEARQNAGS